MQSDLEWALFEQSSRVHMLHGLYVMRSLWAFSYTQLWNIFLD